MTGRFASLIPLLLCVQATFAEPASLRINEIQFVGSHNSYKQAMPWLFGTILSLTQPATAESLDYWHPPIEEQLDLGLRILELDVFNDPDGGTFPVGHVQLIDMASSCSPLRACLKAVRVWSEAHPGHVPIWIMFNAKDDPIDWLPEPAPFDAEALARLDEVLQATWGDRMIQPSDVADRRWPVLDDSRGKVLFLLDESNHKRDLYDSGKPRPMFMNVDADHPAAGVMVINDPIAHQARIERLVRDGFMVRTRSDADTREARSGDTARRDAAFASGAQAVSTDYYLPASHFGTDFQVAPVLRCNPVLRPEPCEVQE